MARFAKIILIFVLTFVLTSLSLHDISPSQGETLRVISLYPGHSDNIYAMGGKDILIALSENDDEDLLPELPRISLRTGAEKILALKPDIVVTRSFAMRINPNLYEVLENAGVKILCLDPPEWNEFDDYLKILSENLGLKPKLKPRVFVEATGREIHTCSPDSWAANLIFMAGGINIANDAKPLRTGSAVASWGVERVLKSLDNLDIYIIQTGAMNNTTLESFYNREWTKALKERNIKVYEIPEKFLSRPSLIGREKALKELNKIFNEWESEK